MQDALTRPLLYYALIISNLSAARLCSPSWPIRQTIHTLFMKRNLLKDVSTTLDMTGVN